VAPSARLPDSHPVPVTVCVTPSLLVHVTESPGAMVIELGEKAKFLISTLCVAASALGRSGKAIDATMVKARAVANVNDSGPISDSPLRFLVTLLSFRCYSSD